MQSLWYVSFTLGVSDKQFCNQILGYSYCQSCVDYQALMPRLGDEPGHQVMSVCAFCIEFLTGE